MNEKKDLFALLLFGVCVFSYSFLTDGLLKTICIYKVIGNILIIKYFEVNKNYRHQGIGEAAIERLLLETGTSKIELDAKNAAAAKFWYSIGLTMIDNQHFYIP